MNFTGFKEWLEERVRESLENREFAKYFIYAAYLDRYREIEHKIFCDMEKCDQYCGVENCPGRD